MHRKVFFLLGVIALMMLASSAALAAPVPGKTNPLGATNAPSVIETTFDINVVFVGYAEADIDMTEFEADMATTYDPIVRYPAFYGIDLPVGIHGDYNYNILFAPESFNDAFFAYLGSAGTPGPLTVFQALYNEQGNRSETVTDTVLYIDGPSTELWLMTQARAQLGVDVGKYTVFFVNWYGRPDFQFHVYTKTSSPDPDTGYNFGELRASRKMIAWGGSHGRTWFYDLSAGPESWTDNWDINTADVDGGGDVDYRMPPIWEYGNLTGYRPFDNLSGDLAKVLRWVAIDLLFTTSPLYDPLATAPHPGFGKRVFVNIFDDDPGSNGIDWISPRYIRNTMERFQSQYPWRLRIKDQPLRGSGAKRSFRIWAGLNPATGCYTDFGDVFAQLFCFFDQNRDKYLPTIRPQQFYNGGVFAFNTTGARLGSGFGLLGYADDDWVSGTPTYVFAFDTPEYRFSGYGFSTTTTHEFGHHIGMSHPHDGYDSTSATDFGPTGDYYFAWSGDESHTVMSYIDLSLNFGWFDQDNMNRFMMGRHLARANEIAAQVRASNAGRDARELLERADADFADARNAYRAMDYQRAADQARAGFERVWRAAELANVNVPLVEPLPPGGPRRGPKQVDPIRFPDN